MSGEEVLLALGEVAIAVAGFSSVVAVFGRRAERAWSLVESFRLATLIANAVAPALLAFLPFALDGLGFSRATVWAASSTVLLVFVVVQVVWIWTQGQRWFRESGEPIRPVVAILSNVCCVGAAVLQVLNIFGWGFHRELGPFLAGLLLVLSIAIVQFCVLVFSSTSAEAPRA